MTFRGIGKFYCSLGQNIACLKLIQRHCVHAWFDIEPTVSTPAPSGEMLCPSLRRHGVHGGLGVGDGGGGGNGSGSGRVGKIGADGSESENIGLRYCGRQNFNLLLKLVLLPD